MKRKFSLMLSLFMLLSVFMTVSSVFAANTEAEKGSIFTVVGDDKTALGSIKTALSKGNGSANSGTGAGTTAITGVLKADAVAAAGTGATSGDTTIFQVGDDKVTFFPGAYNNSTEKSKQAALKTFVEATQKSGMSDQTQQSMFDYFGNADTGLKQSLIPYVMGATSADLYGAMKVINPFLPLIRLILGIGAFIIFLLLMISSVMDLAFIGLPVAREAMQNKGENSKSGKIPFLSSDAISVVKESESALDSSGGYKNAYVMYFKRRAITYIVLSVCVLYLVVGELGGLIGWLLGLVSGFTS